MTRTTTRFVDFRTLQAGGPSAAIVVKLMMAFNDLATVNQCLGDWKNAVARGDKSARPNAGLYFVRVEIAHMAEAFYIIDQVKRDVALMALLARCSRHAQDCFAQLVNFLEGEPNHGEYIRIIEKVRSNVTFHYQCDKLIKKAIDRCASTRGFRSSSITLGDDVRKCHFQLADVVLDTFVVRELWSVPDDEDLAVGADENALRFHEIYLWFMDFASEFAWRYCER